MPTIIEQLARELNRPVEHIENVVKLLDEGNAIPFIARQAKPRVQATALLLSRLVERGKPNVRRYPAILGNPALRAEVFGL